MIFLYMDIVKGKVIHKYLKCQYIVVSIPFTALVYKS